MRYAPLLAVALAPALALLVAGCEKPNTEKLKEAARTPLDFDPTETYDTPRWWTNGDELLFLDETGYYALYEGTNRYTQPSERGRWGQQNYAALWMEPYEEFPGTRIRASIRKIDDEFVLGLRSLDPMLSVEGPPLVIEDRLIGRWSGSLGSLELEADLRYVLRPRRELPQEPATLAGQGGKWKVSKRFLLLRPDSPGVPPSRLLIRDEDEIIILEAPAGSLVRYRPEA